MSKHAFNKIVSKVERLDEYVGYLKELQKVNKKSFLNDYHCFGLAERYLQLAIEVLLDIGKLIILSEGLRKPENNQDIFHVLHDCHVLSESLTNKIDGIAGFRNILVHDYEKIDREIVYEKLHDYLGDLLLFKKEIAKYLKKSIR